MSSRLWRAAAILVPSLLLAGLAAAGSAAAATPAPPGLVTSNFACTNGICEVGPGNVGLSFAAALTGTGGPTYYGPDCPYVLSVVSGSLPPGLQLGGVCGNLLEGIPATAGTYPFTVQIQSMPYPIGQSGPTTGTQQLTVTIGTGSSDRLVLTGAGWNGHTRTLSVTGYDANAGALYSLSVTKTGKQIIAPSPAPGGFRGMAKSATPYPCPTASGCSLTVTDSLGTSATVNLGPPKYRPPLDHAGRGLGVRVLARMFRSGLGYVMRGPFDFRLDRVFEYGLRGLLDDTDVRRRAGSAQAP